MFCVIVLVFVYCLSMSQALVGFGCQGQCNNVTAVSLSWIQRCPLSPISTESDSQYIQLVQERNVEAVDIKHCLVERSYILQHCGMHSHSSMTFNGLVTSEVLRIPQEACNALHLYGSLHTSGGQMLTGFMVNKTTTAPVVEMGTTDAGSATCSGASFTLNGVSYTSLVFTVIVCSLRSEWAD